jgi:hypothetical protein
MMKVSVAHLALGFAAVALSACASVAPPTQVADACKIMAEKPHWWRALKQAERRWDASPALTLAIIRQESSFTHDARPPRAGGFLFLPGKRPSSAFGYAQALDGTWAEYQKAVGERGADRDEFDDAADFIGWYTKTSRERLRLSNTDYAAHYLAYHEGHGGYARGTFRSKRWLVDVANTVGGNARAYAAQLDKCEGRLNRGGWWPL